MANKPAQSAGLSRRAYAMQRGVDESAIRRHVNSGLLAPALLPNNKLDPMLADALLASGTTGGPAPTVDLSEARRRKTAAAVRLLVDEIATLRQSYWHRAEADEFFLAAASELAHRLRRIPVDTAGAAGMSPIDAFQRLTSVVHTALTELADTSTPEDTDLPAEEPFALGHTSVALAAALADLQGERLELKRSIQRGDLVAAEECASDWLRLVTNCRAKLLATPSKLAPMLAVAKGPAEARRMIEAEVEQALEELAEPKESHT